MYVADRGVQFWSCHGSVSLCRIQHLPNLFLHVQMINQMDLICIKWEDYLLVVCCLFRNRKLCLQEIHLHSPLFNIKGSQKLVLKSNSLLRELSVIIWFQHFIILPHCFVLRKNIRLCSALSQVCCLSYIWGILWSKTRSGAYKNFLFSCTFKNIFWYHWKCLSTMTIVVFPSSSYIKTRGVFFLVFFVSIRKCLRLISVTREDPSSLGLLSCFSWGTIVCEVVVDKIFLLVSYKVLSSHWYLFINF